MTMVLVLGLCWADRYRQTRPCAPDELAGLLNRSRATLYRHIDRLQEVGWLKVHRVEGRRLILQPLIRIVEGQPATGEAPCQVSDAFPVEGRMHNQEELRAALQEAGIVGRPFRELLQQNLDPTLVRAWYLWTWAPEQDWMDNPAGYIVNRLRDGDEPPVEFLELAQLTAEETAILREARAHCEQYQGWPSLEGNDKLYRLAPLWSKITEAMRGY
jgi:biotin operon repressor